MTQFSACVEALFTREHAAIADRIRASAAAKLDAVEFWSWRDKDLDAVERALADTGLRLTLFSSEPRSPIVDPAARGEFVEGVRDSVRIAKRLKASALCVLVDDRGVGAPTAEPRAHLSRRAQRAAIVAALREAAPIATDSGVTLLVEPLNSKLDHKGYFLDRTADGLDIVEEVDSLAVRLLYDLYHSAMMGEEPGGALGARGRLVGHVHVADMPGRHEPGSGDIDWASALAALALAGYRGPIGVEFWPRGSTLDALALMRRTFEGPALPGSAVGP